MFLKTTIFIIFILLYKLNGQSHNVCAFFKEDRNKEWKVAYNYNEKKKTDDISVDLCNCNEDEIYKSVQECCSLCTDYIAIMGLHHSNHTLFLDELIDEDIPIIPYGFTSSSPSNRIFKSTFSDEDQIRAIVDIIKHYEWYQVYVLTETNDNSVRLASIFTTLAREKEITQKQSFFKDLSDENVIDQVKSTNMRIICVFSIGIDLKALIEKLNDKDYKYTLILPVSVVDYYMKNKSGDPKILQGHIAIMPYHENSEITTVYESSIKKGIDMLYSAIENNVNSNLTDSLHRLKISNSSSFSFGRYNGKDYIPEVVGTWENGVIEVNEKESEVLWVGNSKKRPGDGTNRLIKWSDKDSYIILAFIILINLILLSTLIIIWINLRAPVIYHSSPAFLTLILVGLIILSFSILPWIDICNTTKCNIGIWLSFFGFGLSIISLIVKTWRIRKIFHEYKKFKVIIITNATLFKYTTILMVPYIVLLSLISGLTDLQKTEPPSNSCSMGKNSFLFIITIGYSIALLIGLIVLSIQTRKAPSKYRETKWINLVSYAIGLCTIIGVALGYAGSILNQLIILAMCIIISVFLVWGFLFIPKLLILFIKGGDISSRKDSSTEITVGNSSISVN